MKITLYTLTFLTLLLLSCPVWAVDAQNPVEAVQSPETNAVAATDNDGKAMQKLDVATQQLMGIRQKIHNTNDPAMQRKLMHQYMMEMHSGMNMMSMMGGMRDMPGMMMGEESNAMPHKGGMGMMGGSHGQMMMAGKKGDHIWNNCMMMDKKMEMMQEMMNGMLMMQEMQLKTTKQ